MGRFSFSIILIVLCSRNTDKTCGINSVKQHLKMFTKKKSTAVARPTNDNHTQRNQWMVSTKLTIAPSAHGLVSEIVWHAECAMKRNEFPMQKKT